MGKGILVAHRAANKWMPENTFESLQRMEAKGARYFEIDCYLMKDGNIAVIHDKNLKRTTTGSGRITNKSAVELLDVYVVGGDGGEKIPMLDQLMEYCAAKDLHLMIEVKDTNLDIVQKIDSLIRQFGEKHFTIYSFHKEIVAAFTAKKPSYEVRYSMEKISKRRLEIAKRMNTGVNLDGRYVSVSCIEKVSAMGLDVHAYTINDKERCEELFEMGVKAICTDTLFELELEFEGKQNG
ncbi:hypothetical protein K0U07_02860 [bacterium]|nr:hypothetical protein [bacterium]